jgi:uncharacterized protein YcbK (DUF882 family)
MTMKKIVLFLTILIACPFSGYAGKIEGDGRLILYSYQTGEILETVFRTEKGYDRHEIQKINKLMRSPDDKIVDISLDLINLLDQIQDHFGAETIEIISGYRSPAYNKNLRMNGRNAAKESLHLKGMAADIHLDEITEKAVSGYAAFLKHGGVGFYPKYNFVHVDVGPARTWGENESKERILVGVDANPNKTWKAITDKNTYFRGDKIKVEVTNVSYESAGMTKNIWVEHFRKGDWREHYLLEKKMKRRIVQPGKSAVYEIVLPADARFGKYRFVIFTSADFNIPPVVSNEFYLKKE